MEKIISQEEFKRLMDIEGEVRGISITGELDFIREREGKEGLKKVEDTINDLGYSIDFEKIKPMDFYPLGLEALVLLSAKKIFGYKESDFEIMGSFEPKVSFLIRLFMKNFFSPQKVIKQVPKIWRESYTVGDMEVTSFDEEKGEAILILKNFKLHPLQCHNLKGYFSSMVKMIMGEEAQCEETQCPFRGGEHHEFVIKW